MISKNLLMIIVFSIVLTFSSEKVKGQQDFLSETINSKDLETFLEKQGLKVDRKVITENTASLRLKNKKKSLEVYITKKNSIEDAQKDLKSFILEVDETLQGRGKKIPIFDIGDESVLRTDYNFDKDVGLDFRRNEYCVLMNGRSVNVMVELAKIIDNYLKSGRKD